MEIKKIKALAEIFKKYGLTSLTVTEGELTVSMRRKQGRLPTQAADPRPEDTANASKTENGVSLGEVYNFSDVTEIKSPLVGTFYLSPSPDAPPYTEIGAKAAKGDTLCIIEAMKLMNEITAETDCEIVDICVKNGDVVEYGQTLFKVI